MRYVVTATMAASVLAIGLGMRPAISLPLGGRAGNADLGVQLVQGQGKGMSGQGGGGSPSMQGPRGGGGLMQGPRGEGGVTQGPRGGGGMHSGRRAEGQFYGPRMGDGSRQHMGREHHHRRHFSRYGWEYGPSYGYTSGCGWMRRRAMETGSSYWWRRYRSCIH